MKHQHFYILKTKGSLKNNIFVLANVIMVRDIKIKFTFMFLNARDLN